MTITEFLTARYDEEEAVARAADIEQGDPRWTIHGPVALSSPRAFRVRSSRDMVPVALVQDVDDGESDPTTILDGEAAAAHIALHDPARILADIAAKRAIVESVTRGQAHEVAETMSGLRNLVARDVLSDVLRLLAQPYAEHADFDPAWRMDP